MASRFSVATPTLVDVEVKIHAIHFQFDNEGKGSEFASDALRPHGLEVGEWPREIQVLELRMEPTTTFRYRAHQVSDGDLQLVTYASEGGDEITLFND